ncbi:endonuclease [Modestobacter sp. I12A-02628]|uniref:Endonuclease n=1 Tax=Goekera deserti TaxID=2497753 RepID=A0A7K3WH45_9ACTN|nr:endonuclease/exonuclease/phosphatase family protein [Goekera deserti]MPQ97283.1 endonuclease [Goekera deserti]NDI50206.1 endonuclease [Goekera deserti]NEL55774.1 endonuclease [Goekera deserti]
MTDLTPKPAPGPDQPPIPVRLVTFNIHHGVGEDGVHDLARTARVLAEADADVICLQEVDRHYGPRSEGVDQALLLSRALDLQLAFGASIDQPPRPGSRERREYGNALLSRLPLLISDVHPLPGTGEPRSALRTMIELDGGALWVTTTHLTNQGADERAAQARALAALHTEPMETGVVVGDLNAGPDAPELGPLRERFTDAWHLAQARADHPRDAGRSFLRREAGRTFSARHPRERIDQVWVSAGVTVTSAEVLDARGSSDHHPLLVELAVRSGV